MAGAGAKPKVKNDERGNNDLKEYGINSVEEFNRICETEGKNSFFQYKDPPNLATAPAQKSRYKRIKLTIRTFLPYNYVEDPFNKIRDVLKIERNKLDLANIRDYAIYNDVEKHGGYKTEQTIIFNFVDFKVNYNPQMNFKVPPTILLNLVTNKSEVVPNDEHSDDSIVISEGKSINNLKYLSFLAIISAGNPAVNPSPNIDYRIGIALREDGFYDIEGEWDGFPAIEIFMEELDTRKVDLIYFKGTSDARETTVEPKEIWNLIDGKGDIRIKANDYFGNNKFDNNRNPYEDVGLMKQKFKIR